MSNTEEHTVLLANFHNDWLLPLVKCALDFQWEFIVSEQWISPCPCLTEWSDNYYQKSCRSLLNHFIGEKNKLALLDLLRTLVELQPFFFSFLVCFWNMNISSSLVSNTTCYEWLYHYEYYSLLEFPLIIHPKHYKQPTLTTYMLTIHNVPCIFSKFTDLLNSVFHLMCHLNSFCCIWPS